MKFLISAVISFGAGLFGYWLDKRASEEDHNKQAVIFICGIACIFFGVKIFYDALF